MSFVNAEPNELTVLSTFSGAGGLDLGLERAGFETLGCIELDSLARETIALNRPTWQLLESGDVAQAGKKLKPRDLGLQKGDLSVIAGGPPCQPFSKAAQWASTGRRGTEDIRGRLVHGMLDLVDSFLPQVLLIENVAGFLQGSLSTASEIQTRLNEINRVRRTRYALDWRVVDSAHFGVPQRRQRAIAVATRSGDQFEWPKATHLENPITAWDAIGKVKSSRHVPTTGGWTDLLGSIPEGNNYLWHTPRGGGQPLFGWRTRYWSFLLKLAKNQPAWTLPASPGPNTGPFHWDSRALTIDERLALQSFPTSWQLEGDARSQVKLVGNATPPLLAEIMGRAIAEQIFGRSPASSKPELLVSRSRVTPAPERVKKVPKQYLHHLGEHAEHPGTGKGPAPRKKIAV